MIMIGSLLADEHSCIKNYNLVLYQIKYHIKLRPKLANLSNNGWYGQS